MDISLDQVDFKKLSVKFEIPLTSVGGIFIPSQSYFLLDNNGSQLDGDGFYRRARPCHQCGYDEGSGL